jgi:hypothetical protein
MVATLAAVARGPCAPLAWAGRKAIARASVLGLSHGATMALGWDRTPRNSAVFQFYLDLI